MSFYLITNKNNVPELISKEIMAIHQYMNKVSNGYITLTVHIEL